ncbi:hypothetical protein EJD97_016099 [Solanum chilense]|uniref:Uncharacterized protein n=1 Tax=Solanum chilense TaxID=4083 RepID=A0A6N2B868_SOLCI|nr:hypothetical protein EJD97_016099 [Solanum chilense]
MGLRKLFVRGDCNGHMKIICLFGRVIEVAGKTASKNLTTQYRFLVMDLKIKRTKKKPIIYSLALLILELHKCIKIEASPTEHHLNMPKDTSVNSFSVNQSRASPYSCSSDNSDLDFKKSLPSVVNEREWEEAKCPICLEHPHNAVLLLCSSRDKGCQPYMSSTRRDNVSGAVSRRESRGQALSGASRFHMQKQPELTCPLCRGHVEGWIVVKAARNFMNSKTRSCALEACNFSGNYAELRNHARQEHPLGRPSEVDPMRQSNWTRLGLQREFEDGFLAYLPLELPLDTGLFDVPDSHYSEADAGLEIPVDVELEFCLSFLIESVPSPWDWSPSYGGRRTNRPESGARPQNRRSRF